MAIRLETVEAITADRDLVKRHIIFLSAEYEGLKAKTQLLADEELRLKEIELRLADCTLYLAKLEQELPAAIAELSTRIKRLGNLNFELLLTERYVLLKPMRVIAEELAMNVTAVYAAHNRAKKAFNEQNNLPFVQDPRGRRKGTPNT